MIEETEEFDRRMVREAIQKRAEQDAILEAWVERVLILMEFERRDRNERLQHLRDE